MDGLSRAFALLGLILLATGGRAEAQEPVTAVWKERQLRFSYHRSDAVHSCSELQSRITNVLRAAGARPDLKVTVRNCDVLGVSRPAPGHDGIGWPQDALRRRPGYGSGVEARQEIDVYLHLWMPVETTPEVIAELKADRKRRELITEVTGDPLPLFDDPIPFTAQWQVVTLSRKTTGIEPADCELLERLVASSFKTLGIQVVRRNFACHRGWVSHIAPTLDVKALIPTSFRVAEAEETSEPGVDEPDSPSSRDSGGARGTATGEPE